MIFGGDGLGSEVTQRTTAADQMLQSRVSGGFYSAGYGHESCRQKARRRAVSETRKGPNEGASRAGLGAAHFPLQSCPLPRRERDQRTRLVHFQAVSVRV